MTPDCKRRWNKSYQLSLNMENVEMDKLTATQRPTALSASFDVFPSETFQYCYVSTHTFTTL